MTVFLITVVIFALVITAMSVGVLAGRQPIKGSCGGIGATGITQSCEICGGDPQRCDSEEAMDSSEPQPAPQFYSADKQ
ncbi:(Na+)-NQR maturation NqrM [Parahaliea sp. F7430]|uniref:(Na+)-NQR maturation NqrM n=1 Tax=Sediminihaliea albiluteola TaxID=2758564 RepID=A0A7W2TUC6_9GAMM|nr:(Na+)-NQR maturation NqrM [Sediminihaliea albiluteola]MBA6412119.1 (Na+)-NQR maturation NqrM [Sediminihaliea albiluteola]